MTSVFKVSIEDTAVAKKASARDNDLKLLCLEESEKFSDFLQKSDRNFPDGITKWEKQIIATYLFQKMKGRLNVAAPGSDNVPASEDEAHGTS